ncbi:hypothetical protein vseg_015491 [Gypsophila vaccaria]
MGYSEADSSKCRRHPCLRQSPGVCSSCLREKLSKLSTASPSLSLSPKLSSPPYYSSSSSSTTTTAHRRNGSAAYVSVGMVLNNNNNNNNNNSNSNSNSNNNGLKKSRSVSCASLSTRSKFRGNDAVNNDKLKTGLDDVDDEEGCNNSLKKKNGFIKKLMNTTSKKTRGVLMHSKTMNERSLSSSATSTSTSTSTVTIQNH